MGASMGGPMLLGRADAAWAPQLLRPHANGQHVPVGVPLDRHNSAAAAGCLSVPVLACLPSCTTWHWAAKCDLVPTEQWGAGLEVNPKDEMNPEDAFDRVVNWINREENNNKRVEFLHLLQKLHHEDMQNKTSMILASDQACKACQKLVLVLEDRIEDLQSTIQSLEFEKLKAKNCANLRGLLEHMEDKALARYPVLCLEPGERLDKWCSFLQREAACMSWISCYTWWKTAHEQAEVIDCNHRKLHGHIETEYGNYVDDAMIPELRKRHGHIETEYGNYVDDAMIPKLRKGHDGWSVPRYPLSAAEGYVVVCLAWAFECKLKILDHISMPW